jgi:cold-inducible RNA-binding protein
MNIYVGNLPSELREEDLKKEFSAYGEVTSVNIVNDMYSGLPKGFAFVEMPSRTDGETAINNLKGKTLKGRTIEVSKARPHADGSSNRGQKGRQSPTPRGKR